MQLQMNNNTSPNALRGTAIIGTVVASKAVWGEFRMTRGHNLRRAKFHKRCWRQWVKVSVHGHPNTFIVGFIGNSQTEAGLPNVCGRQVEITNTKNLSQRFDPHNKWIPNGESHWVIGTVSENLHGRIIAN